jgi:hypothetical protein
LRVTELRNDAAEMGKAARFSASQMILEPTFSAAGGLSFEINWPISSGMLSPAKPVFRGPGI